MDNDSEKPKKKRGKRNPDEYKREVIKKSRVSGISYQKWNGEMAPAVIQGPDCKCRMKCFERVAEEERNIVFRSFRELNTKNEQDCLLQSLISIHGIQRRRRIKPADTSKMPDRLCTFKYVTQGQNGTHAVCRKAFTAIFGITNDRLRRLTTLRREGTVPIDQRGKNRSGNAKPGHVINTIMDHIASFPVKIAHYTTREYRYLNEKFNIKIMFSLFKQKHRDLPVKYSYYKKIFNEQFSLTFGRPQVDTCSTCEELDTKIKSKVLNDTAKRVATAEKAVHIKRAKKFYSKMKSVSKECKENPKMGAICIDYMQNLQLPVIPVQETFYLRQLTVNVLCIHNLKNDKATFYVYHEGTGTKGPNEVVSFILHYLNSNREFDGIDYFHFFSDACAAQNRNHTLIRFFSALVSTKRFKHIEQYYPIRGHSFLPCDRDFAVLKRKIKKSDRVYVIKEYAELILTSNKDPQKYTVVLPTSDFILNFKKWWPTFYKKSMLSNESLGRDVPRHLKTPFKISQFRQFTHSKDQEGIIIAKEFIDGFQSHTFRLRNSNKDTISFPTMTAYSGNIPINVKKMQDLKKLAKYIPDDEETTAFYSVIFGLPTCDHDMNERLDLDDD